MVRRGLSDGHGNKVDHGGDQTNGHHHAAAPRPPVVAWALLGPHPERVKLGVTRNSTDGHGLGPPPAAEGQETRS